MTAMSRVVVGVSGSPGCLPAVRYAAELARAHRAPLIPVLAWQPPGGDLADRSHPSPALRDLWAEAAGRRLHRTLLTAFGVLPSDISLQPHVVRGDPGRSLVEAASKASDLLVIGTGRRPMISRAVRPSVSRYCLAHACCPVLAVPPSPLDRALRRFWLRGWTLRRRPLSPADITATPPATRT
jgi:nucleotide-binding universal stress UspA family protein